MKINIKNNNKIENSNIGQNNVIQNNKEKNSIWKLVMKIFIDLIITVLGGYILFKLTVA